MLKFNVDRAARCKPGLGGIGEEMLNDKEEVLCLFSKGVGVKDCNEAEVLTILEALRIFPHSFYERLIVDSDSSNATSWMTIGKAKAWKL